MTFRPSENRCPGCYREGPAGPCSRCLLEFMENGGVPQRCLSMRFENFQTSNAKLLTKVQFLQEWLKGERSIGLLLTGSCGIGKTHLAVAVMRELLRIGEGVTFISASEFALRCQGAFQQESSPDAIIKASLRTRFLLLDDLGSDGLSRDYVTPLIEAAYNKNRVLIATSNLTLKAMNANSPRVASRLLEMCSVLEFLGDDFRLEIAKGRQVVR